MPHKDSRTALDSLTASRMLVKMMFCLLPVLCPASLRAQETSDEFWPELDVFLKLNSKSRIFFLYSATKLDARQTYSDGSFGVHLDVYAVPLLGRRLLPKHTDPARSKSFMVRVGYLYSRTPSGSSDPFSEHTPTLETHWRFPLPGSVLLTDRNRLDFRIKDDNYQPRYRNRLKLERTFKVGCLDVTPYAHAEAFYDWKFNKFHRFRYAAGAEVSLGRYLVLESYYLRQRDTVTSPPHVNAVGAALQFYWP